MRDAAHLLGTVNWDFPTSLPGVGKSIHWYPGTFPHALPSTLIEAFTQPSDLVFDPYGGIGTAAFEAIRQGRSALLMDANPVAVAAAMLSCVLIYFLRHEPSIVSGVLEQLAVQVEREERSRQREMLWDSASVPQPRADVGTELFGKANDIFNQCVIGEPRWELLDPWFHNRTLGEMKALYQKLVVEQADPVVRLAGIVMMSAVLRASSSQTASWGHVADNVMPKELVYKPIYLQCKYWLTRTNTILQATELLPSNAHRRQAVDIRLMNWMNGADAPPPSKRASLLVTSPPYSSAIDYTLAQRLSQYLFGYSDDSVMTMVSGEIGARRKRFQSAPEEIWATQLATALENQLKLVRSDGVVCVVLPHKQSGRLLGAEAFEVVLDEMGWKPLWAGSRSIRQSRTRQSWTSIQKETIQIFVGRDY